MNRYFLSAIFFLTLFPLSLASSETLQYWIRSHRWDLIENYFRSNSPSRETEVYSLIEFHGKSPNGDIEKRFLYLISQVKGSFVPHFDYADIETILQNPLPHQSVIFRLSFWRLYEEMEKRKLWKPGDQSKYLEKLSLDTDPIARKVLEKLASLYLEAERHSDLISLIDKLPQETRAFFLQKEIKLYYAKALAKSGELEKAKQEFIELAGMESTPDFIRSFVYQDLKKYLPPDAFLSLSARDLFPLLNQLAKEEANSFLKKNQMEFRSRIERKESFRQAGLYLARNNETELLKAIVLSNKVHLDEESEFLGQFGMQLYYNNNCSDAVSFLETFPDVQEPGKYRVLALCYDKLGQSDKSFKNLVRYLELYPFNLYYQDMLLEKLIGKPDRRNYALDSYWRQAIESIPNLPVKGRLYYWYLRYLRDTGRKQELLSRLESYYGDIAGSYYTRVIQEEFREELSQLQVPKNPTENKRALIRYLSHTAGIPRESKEILRKNLGFAYFDKSFDLVVRLTNTESKVRGERLLSLATEYFRLGEDSLGMSLVQFYADTQKISTIRKEEILAAIGVLSRNTYYSAFYTRSLLKRLRIPDDPILLPTSVSSRMYPRPHRELVQKYAEEAGITEEVLYAVMRQESFFKENAVSRSNAQGLMQIMPATGKEIASKLGIRSYSLFNPDTSIRFGAIFLGYLMRTYGNELRWAAIAYNGGPGNLRKWKRTYYRGDFNHFLEEIPYKESRDYSRIVVSNFYAYEILKYYHGL